MSEERTSRCGWEVLSLGRRHNSYKGDQDDFEIQHQPSIFKVILLEQHLQNTRCVKPLKYALLSPQI